MQNTSSELLKGREKEKLEPVWKLERLNLEAIDLRRRQHVVVRMMGWRQCWLQVDCGKCFVKCKKKQERGKRSKRNETKKPIKNPKTREKGCTSREKVDKAATASSTGTVIFLLLLLLAVPAPLHFLPPLEWVLGRLERFCPKFATVLCNSWDPTQNIHCTLRGRFTRS
jgi:hypothetical protein